MRKELARHQGQRKKFRAVFTRFGRKLNYNGHSEPTVLLSSIIDFETHIKVADHCWFSFTKGFEGAGLKEGKEGHFVEFEARIKEYQKGYVNKKYGINHQATDFKLSHPTKIKMVSTL